MTSDLPRITAIVRTRDSFPRVEDTIRSLRMQTDVFLRIIVVDSGSIPSEVDRLRDLADLLIDISGQPFNYSRAINVALPNVDTDLVLVISSHVRIEDAGVLSSLCGLMRPDTAAAYICADPKATYFSVEKIDRNNFTGSNGLYNQFALIPRRLLEEQKFREDVFSCEDQVWAVWALHQKSMHTLRVAASLVHVDNPHGNLFKWLNEEVALAYFVDRSRLSIHRIGALVIHGLWLWSQGRERVGKNQIILAMRLLKAKFIKPVYQSKYF